MQYVAFLRAVNVGGRTVKNEPLAKAFTELGFDGVATFLASGNVVFETTRRSPAALQRDIEAQLLNRFGFPVEVMLRSMSAVAALASANPFGLAQSELDGFTVHVCLFNAKPPIAMHKSIQALRSDYDDFRFKGHELFWLCRGPKISVSPLFKGNALTKALTELNTMRKQATLARLVAKYGQST